MNELAVMLGLALLCSSPGFWRVVFFVSYGYGISVTVLCAAALCMVPEGLGPVSVLHAAFVMLYGVRLTKFIAERDRKPGYAEAIRELRAMERRIGPLKRVFIWVACAALYVCMASPVLFGLQRGLGGSFATWGIALMLGGLALEWEADREKSRFKDKHPRRYCDQGLYRACRHPNYLGEIIFWCGVFVTGIPAYAAPLHWGLASLGLVCIVLIMLGSTRRLEQEQRQRYADTPGFDSYAATTPVLFPGVPLYTLRHMPIVIG